MPKARVKADIHQALGGAGGSGIVVIGGATVSTTQLQDLALNSILLLKQGAAAPLVFDLGSAGFAAALAAAGSRDVIWTGAGTINGDHTIPASVTVASMPFSRTAFTGCLTLGNGAVLNGLELARAADQAGDLVCIVPPSAAGEMAYCGYCWIVAQNATGAGYAVKGACDHLTLRSCYVSAQSAGADANPFGSTSTTLVAYYRAEEASGDRADATGNGHTLTAHGAVGQAAGVQGNAADFAGTDLADYLSSASDDFDGGDTDFTWFGWIYPESDGTNTDYVVVKSQGTEALFLNGYAIALDNAGTPALCMLGANGMTTIVACSATITLNAWHFVVGWHDAVNDKICIQVDGAAAVETATAGVVPLDAAYDLWMGRYVGTATNHMFAGLVDELCFYRGVLSSADRAWLYNAGSGRTWSEVSARFSSPGTPYVHGCIIPNADGRAVAIPEWGDRSAWDVADYGARHASDWTAGDSHHAAVTLGAGSDPALVLSGQELMLTLPDEASAQVDAAAGAALIAGDCVQLYNDSGLKCRPADASLNRSADGYVTVNVDPAATATVYLDGVNDALAGLTVGTLLYLSTAGDVTATAPSTAGYIVQELGRALSATSMAFTRQHTVLLA